MEISLQTTLNRPNLKSFLLPAIQWVMKALNLPSDAGVGFLLCGLQKMASLNGQFRGKTQPTNVLAFPGEKPYIGDVVICVPVAEKEAPQFGLTPKEMLVLLVIHGILHCLGYDHEKDRGEMEALQEALFRRWKHCSS